VGSAPHYRRGRPPYSPALEATLVNELGLDGRGTLLDVGCGPGTLTVRLAGLFENVVGLDPDADMLEQGRLAANDAGLTNVTWIQARAEDLPQAAPGPFRVVTFGQSFHRTDELTVAQAVYDMLEPGGAVVMIAHSVEGRPVPPPPGHPPIPHRELEALVIEYLGSITRMGQGHAQVRDHQWQDILVQTRFGEVDEVYAPGIPDLLRDTESVISGYLSMSWSAPHLYGDRLDEFVAEARALLAARSADGLFWDWPGDTAIVIGRKPGPSAGA
jgi:ubiquinone/menaquinone biosynthesis C-methylase UbiE